MQGQEQDASGNEHPEAIVSDQAETEPVDPRTQAIWLLRKMLDNPSSSLMFEIDLERLGLLTELEKAEIIPLVENPNPFFFSEEEKRHEVWWIEHPEEAGKFRNSIERREESLKLIFLGVVLSGVFPELIPQRISTPGNANAQ